VYFRMNGFFPLEKGLKIQERRGEWRTTDFSLRLC